VAPLKTADLAGLVNRNQSSHVSDENQVDQLTREVEEATVTDALRHVRQLDPLGLEKTLENAAVSLTRQKLLHSVVQPMFERIGELWAAGKLKIIHEHMATVVTRSILLDLLKTEVLTDGAPKLVVATPVGQWHEAGALVAALTAAEAGWRPLYFGPNLPAEEIAAAVKQTRSKAVALSICHRIERALLQRELRKLRRFTENGIPVLVGGYVVGDIAEVISGARAKCISSVDVFKAELGTLQKAS
jgi:methanogenic corrinoid protein MtbC1